MNKIYKVVWSRARGCYVVASEFAKNTAKGASVKALAVVVLAAGLMAGGISGSAWAVNPAPEDKDIVIGSGAKIIKELATEVTGGIAIGKNTQAFAQGGNKARSILFGNKSYTNGIAIGENSYALTDSINLGIRNYTESIGNVNLASYERNLSTGVGSTTIGSNSYSGGTLSTILGSYSIMTTDYMNGNNGFLNFNVFQNFGATAIGVMNSIESHGTNQYTSGIANSIVGLANTTYNSNGALIFGAGNEIKNSIASISHPGSTKSVTDAAESFRESVKTSSGGSTLAIGGGNYADYTLASQMTGVRNSITGTAQRQSTNNSYTGVDNKGENVSYTTVIGTDNRLENTNNANVFGNSNSISGGAQNIIVGDKHELKEAQNNIILGYSDAVEEPSPNLENSVIIGHNANAKQDAGVAVGNGAKATGKFSVSIGNAAVAEGDSGIAIGNSAQAKNAGSVALGDNSRDNELGGYTESEITNVRIWDKLEALSFAGAASDAWGTVSIGDSGGKRTLTNLAAGRISSTSTDAVNGSQLYAVADALNNRITDVENKLPVVKGDGPITVKPTKSGAGEAGGNEITIGFDGGIDFAGDKGDNINADIVSSTNPVVTLKGGAKGELSDGNIGVVAETGTKTLNIQLAKDLQGLKSVASDNVIVNEEVTIADTTVINESGIATNKISIGSVSVTKDGIDAGGQKITNVADGAIAADSKNAVNGSQLHATNQAVQNNAENISRLGHTVDKLGSRVNKVGAGAAALAALHPLDFDPDEKLNVAAGYGHYKGEDAASIGAFYRPNEDTMFSIGGTVGNGEDMINVGVSFRFGQQNHQTRTKKEMAKEIIDLRMEVAELKAMMYNLSGSGVSLDPAKQELFPDVPENHWAYEYAAALKGNGILEGYADGSFDGSRPMTRYEFAAALYRALSKGVAVDERMLKEFGDVLARIRVDVLTREHNNEPHIERVRVIPKAEQKAARGLVQPLNAAK